MNSIPLTIFEKTQRALAVMLYDSMTRKEYEEELEREKEENGLL